MNNYYALIYLKEELKEKIEGGFFSFAISPHKNVLECYIETDSETNRLIFSSDPRETAIFLDTYRPPKKSNVIEFFNGLEGKKIVKISLANNDRLLYLYFENGMHLLFKLFSGNPNTLLVENDKIIDAFKSPDQLKGEYPPEPYGPAFANEVSTKAKPKNQLTSLNPLLPRNLLPFLIDQYEVGTMDAEEVKAFAKKITDELLNRPCPRVLKNGDLCLWSERVLDRATEKSFDTVNEAVLFAYRNAVHLRRLHNKKESIDQLLERMVSKKESQLQQLQQSDKSLERAEEYERCGHLLMANIHETVEYGTEQLTVDNFYNENRPVEIPLKQGLSIAENAAYYYDKAKSSKKSFEEARRRVPGVKAEAEKANKLLEELREVGHLPALEKWIKNNKEHLSTFGYGTDDDVQASSPYRKFKAGKYEIWVGKNARSNDELTSLAHKEDIWLHARGVGGSHVVIRMGNQKDYPPRDIILKAASYAAYYSKARGMKMAPVMYSKRKYVRKPKGADPGAVVVEREQVEMVPPLKPGTN